SAAFQFNLVALGVSDLTVDFYFDPFLSCGEHGYFCALFHSGEPGSVFAFAGADHERTGLNSTFLCVGIWIGSGAGLCGKISSLGVSGLTFYAYLHPLFTGA